MIVYEPTDEEHALTEEWHGGQSTMFYAILSTGNLSTGTLSRGMSDEDWRADLLANLEREVRETIQAAEKQGEWDDVDVLRAWRAKLV